ncbi:MAG: bifunctional adenosylcobinamide kinase/adenosylcobinamide-phosphate guanylyltransferase [Spirochaetes bacterium]|nr:bifunctional adenosylcobinamide kinase/adenosylcobinamide-phosphate guanylyltransferase [Spirochaetota bacterium]
MGKIIFITGGARSGKSGFAESLLSGKDDVLYVATGIGFDDEMKDRIRRHRSQRNQSWETVECWHDVAAAVRERLAGRGRVLLDCVTIMINNIMVVDSRVDWDTAGMDEVDRVEKSIRKEMDDIMRIASEHDRELLVVSNELGLGIVPAAPLGRHYRDIAGKINQMIAAAADEVYFLVSGIPLKIK